MKRLLSNIAMASIAGTILLALPANLFAADDKRVDVYAVPRDQTKPNVVQKVLGPSYQPYLDVKQNPNPPPQGFAQPRRDDLTGSQTIDPSQHPNLWKHNIDINKITTLDEARRWVAQPNTEPDRRSSSQPQGAAVPIRNQTPFFTTGRQERTTPADADHTISRYKVQPGGVVLEGTATGVGTVDKVRYDGVLNALVLDDRALYFLPITPESAGILCRAIAEDDRIGVSLGSVQLVFGGPRDKVPTESQIAIDLKLTDKFFGDIVFARKEFIGKDRLANGFQPQPHQGAFFNVAAFFTFNDFRFAVEKDELRAVHGNLIVRLVPLSEERSAEGGHLPDRAAVSQGVTSVQYEANARHVADNVNYYRREESVDRTFRYGEFVALIRALKAQGVDLRDLAAVIETASGSGPRPAGPSVTTMQQPIDGLFAAWQRLDLPLYLAQWSPNAVQYIGPQPRRFAQLRQERERIFSQLASVYVSYTPLYRGYQHGVGYFDSTYTMILQYRSGATLRDSACESYKVRQEAGRWVIIENQDYKQC
jgi:hypothetical protein